MGVKESEVASKHNNVSKEKILECMVGIALFAICYSIIYILSLYLYMNIVSSVLFYEGAVMNLPPSVVAPCITSLVIAFIGTAFHVIYARKISRIFLIMSLLALTVTYYIYLHFIVVSRNLTVKLLPLFDLMSSKEYSVLSLDLGQVGLIGVVYILRREAVNLIRKLI